MSAAHQCSLCALPDSEWLLSCTGTDRSGDGTREALLTLGNGYLASRGAAPEVTADGVHYPATYVAGVYNRLDSSVDGRVRRDESLINLPNWLPLTVRADDNGPRLAPDTWRTVHQHVALDLRRGLHVRELVVEDPRNRRTRIRQERFVSMDRPHLACLRTTVTPQNWSGRLHVRSLLDGRVSNNNLRVPELTRALPLHRYRRLPQANRLACEVGGAGALFPWQSGSDGREETPEWFYNPRSRRWMADNSRRQYHVNLAVAYNVWQYYQVTADIDFLASYGAELLVEIVRFWAAIAEHHPVADRYHLRGVMGPDEFHDGYPDSPGAGVNDNAYVAVMTSWVLARVLDTRVQPQVCATGIHALANDHRQRSTQSDSSFARTDLELDLHRLGQSFGLAGEVPLGRW